MPFPHFDKVFHVGEYLPFGFLAARAIRRAYNPGYGAGAATVLTLIYALTDEFHQSFVEGRSSSAVDLIADTVGGFLGALIYTILFKRKAA